MNVLLVDCDFPNKRKSINHSDRIPIGLLKIGNYHKKQGDTVRLIRLGKQEYTDFKADVCFVTSSFTYYSEAVMSAVRWCRFYQPQAYVIVGGIWASLMPQKCKELTGADKIIVGTYCDDYADYTLLDEPIDFQILHTTRGCIRNCGFCGITTIEPTFKYKKTLLDEIEKQKLVFYDNNFLANPYIENILGEMIQLRKDRKLKSVTCQSGVDLRILLRKPPLARMLYEAGFRDCYFAWDSKEGFDQVKKVVDLLADAGFKRRACKCFMLYNHELGYDVLEEKRRKCFELGIQIMDCRYRPLTLLRDGYRSHKPLDDNYYIHPNWSNREVRQFRKNVRRHNICVRWRMTDYYDGLKQKIMSKEEYMKLSTKEKEELEGFWNPRKHTKLGE